MRVFSLKKIEIHQLGFTLAALMLSACGTLTADTSLANEREVLRSNQKAEQPATYKGFQTSLQQQSGGSVGRAPEGERKPYVVLGQSNLIAAQSAPQLIVPEIREGETVILSFDNMPIEDALNAILGDILKQRFIVEAPLTGNLTLQSSGPIKVSDLFPILETTLKSRGASIIAESDYVRIVPLSQAQRQGRMMSKGSAIGFGIQVQPLIHIVASEMARILEPIAPEGSILRVDRTRNLLVLSGTQRELSSLVETIELFDVDWLSGMSFGVYPLKSTEPDALIADLEAVFAAGGQNPAEGGVSFLPNQRLKSIIAITPTPSVLRHVESWISRLDAIGTQTTEQLYVYDVQNGTAAELAQVLQSVLGGGGASRSVSRSVAPNIPTRRLSNEGERISSTGTSRPSAAQVSGFEVGNESSLISGESVSIFPYDSKNSLVIVATADDYANIETILKKLDVVSNQVLLEATIAEVTLRDELQFGLQWFFQNGDSEATLTNSNIGGVNSVFPGFSYIFSQQDARVALNALSSVTDVNVISSPSLMVLDNQTAILQVGDEVPVVTQQSVTNSVNTPIFNSITFRDTGVILRVTPRVNDSGLVLLDIEQEVSSVVETVTSGIDSPTIQQRRIETTVAVNDGESLALGGLIESGVIRTSSGVPILSDLPVLGRLFKTQTDRDERTELLVIITPRVIRNQDEARKVTDEYRRRLNTLSSVTGLPIQ